MSITIRIKDCIDNHDKYVEILATKSDKELSKRLNLVHVQMEIAGQKTNTGSLELLEIWRAQIIQARIYKAENNIPDTPSEIDLALTDMESQEEITEQRQEILNKKTPASVEEKQIKYPENESKIPDKPEQLSLF